VKVVQTQTNKFAIIGLLVIIVGILAGSLIFFAPLGYYGVEVKLEGNTDPLHKKAVIYVDGQRAAEGEVYMSFITPREYKIEMMHDGYESQTRIVKVERFSVRNKPVDHVILAKLYSFDIRSDPPGADIYLEGSPTGLKTPAILKDQKAGKHTIKLDLAGFPPIGYTIDTTKDPVTMNFSFKQGMTALFETEPNGSAVYIDNKEMGITPCRIDGLAAKQYLLEFRLEGYRTYKGMVDIGITGNQLKVNLDKLPVVPVLSDPSDVDVKMDGVLIGKTPVIAYPEPGKHVFVIGGKEIQVDIKGDQAIIETFEHSTKKYVLTGEDGIHHEVEGQIGSFDAGLPNGKYKVSESINGGWLRLGSIDWQGKPVVMPGLQRAPKTVIETMDSNAIWLVIKKGEKGKEEDREQLGIGKVELDFKVLLEKAGNRQSYVFEIGGGDLKTTLELSKAEILAGIKYSVEVRK